MNVGLLHPEKYRGMEQIDGHDSAMTQKPWFHLTKFDHENGGLMGFNGI